MVLFSVKTIDYSRGKNTLSDKCMSLDALMGCYATFFPLTIKRCSLEGISKHCDGRLEKQLDIAENFRGRQHDMNKREKYGSWLFNKYSL